MTLKASLHIHIKGDGYDYIRYTGLELLDEAKRLNFDVIAFTCHDRVVMSETFQNHAKSLGILLIPGIEVNLGGHVLVLNADAEAEKLRTLGDLRRYRETHPQIFTIAAHPFFPQRSICLQERIHPHIDLFDGIEHSWFYSKKIDFNKKALNLAIQHDLPTIATSDVHRLEMLKNDHVLIDAEKNVESIFEALRKKQFENVQKPKRLFQMLWTFAKMQTTVIGRTFPTDPLRIKNETLPPRRQRKSSKKSKTNRASRGI